MAPRLQAEDTRLLLDRLGDLPRAAVARLPGARWLPYEQCFSFPVTPTAAAQIAEALPGLATDAGVDSLLEAARSIAEAQAFKDPDYSLDPLPFDSPTEPWRHQLAAYWFGENLPAVVLSMGLGTGKSKVALDLIQGRGHRLTLIVCPLSVVPAWAKQVELHASYLYCAPLDGKSVKAKTDQAVAAIEVAETMEVPLILAINYESLWRPPFARFALEAGFDCVVYDEAHKLKSAGSKVSMFAARLSDRTPSKLALSGTVLANSPLDAYGVFRAMDKGIFGTSFARFRGRYAVMGGFQNYQVIGYRNQAEFAKRFYSITFRADRDVLDLPPASTVERVFDLPVIARQTYRNLKTQFVAAVAEGRVTAGNALTRLLRLQQVTSGDVRLDDGEYHDLHGAKQSVLEDVLEEIGPEPVVVFCRFVRDLNRVASSCEALGLDYRELSGRSKQLEEWQEGNGQVLGVQIQAGGVGVDMTRAAYCVWYSIGFSLAEFRQAEARCHRPGQTRPVTYVRLIARGTVDAQVFRAIDKKAEIIETILAETERGES